MSSSLRQRVVRKVTTTTLLVVGLTTTTTNVFVDAFTTPSYLASLSPILIDTQQEQEQQSQHSSPYDASSYYEDQQQQATAPQSSLYDYYYGNQQQPSSPASTDNNGGGGGIASYEAQLQQQQQWFQQQHQQHQQQQGLPPSPTPPITTEQYGAGGSSQEQQQSYDYVGDDTVDAHHQEASSVDATGVGGGLGDGEGFFVSPYEDMLSQENQVNSNFDDPTGTDNTVIGNYEEMYEQFMDIPPSPPPLPMADNLNEQAQQPEQQEPPPPTNNNNNLNMEEMYGQLMQIPLTDEQKLHQAWNNIDNLPPASTEDDDYSTSSSPTTGSFFHQGSVNNVDVDDTDQLEEEKQQQQQQPVPAEDKDKDNISSDPIFEGDDDDAHGILELIDAVMDFYDGVYDKDQYSDEVNEIISVLEDETTIETDYGNKNKKKPLLDDDDDDDDEEDIEDYMYWLFLAASEETVKEDDGQTKWIASCSDDDDMAAESYYDECDEDEDDDDYYGGTGGIQDEHHPVFQNVLGTMLRPCGNYQGFCSLQHNDQPQSVCCEMTREFLDSPHGKHLWDAGIKVKDVMCLGVEEWIDAYNDGLAPPVYLEATTMCTLEEIDMDFLRAYALDHDEALERLLELQWQKARLKKIMEDPPSTTFKERNNKK